MRVLGIDTSSIVATCAIMDDDKLVGEYILNHKRTHSQKIMPIVKEILSSCDLAVDDIDVFAVSSGPGSFTGLRIGVTTVKSLAHVTDKPVVGVSTLDALAYNLPYCEGLIVPMMDARRDRVFTGIYKWVDGELTIVHRPTAIEVEKLMEILKDKNERVVFNGDGTLVYREEIVNSLGNRAIFSPKSSNMARASSVAELALLRAREGKLESYMELTPEYLRKSQAQREYDERQKIKGEGNE